MDNNIKKEPGFLMRYAWIRPLMSVSPDVRHKVLDAIFNYALTGQEPEQEDIKVSIFAAAKEQIEIDRAKYQRRVKTNRENAQKSRSKRSKKDKLANGSQSLPMGTNKNKSLIKERDLESSSLSESEDLSKSQNSGTAVATIITKEGRDYVVQYGKEILLPVNYPQLPGNSFYWDEFEETWKEARS